MKIFVKLCVTVFLGVILQSCSLTNTYYSDIIAVGEEPTAKTFVISTVSESEYDFLTYKEYSNVLKRRLEELGYTYVQDGFAELNISLNFSQGEEFLVSKVTTVEQSADSQEKKVTSKLSSASTDSTIKTSSEAKIVTNQSVRYITGVPVSLVIEAVNSLTNLPVWRVQVESMVERGYQVSEIVPWLINASQWYIGKSWSGRVLVGVGKDLEEHFGQEYNLQNIRQIQSEYYKGGYDVFLTTSPLQ